MKILLNLNKLIQIKGFIVTNCPHLKYRFPMKQKINKINFKTKNRWEHIEEPQMDH